MLVHAPAVGDEVNHRQTATARVRRRGCLRACRSTVGVLNLDSNKALVGVDTNLERSAGVLDSVGDELVPEENRVLEGRLGNVELLERSAHELPRGADALGRGREQLDSVRYAHRQ